MKAAAVCCSILFWFSTAWASDGVTPGSHTLSTEIHDIAVLAATDEYMVIEVEYSYDGEHNVVMVGAQADLESGKSMTGFRPQRAWIGSRNKVLIRLSRRRDQPVEFVTTRLKAYLYVAGQVPFLIKAIDYPYRWPMRSVPTRDPVQTRAEHHDALLERAVDLINAIDYLGDRRLELAKRYLDEILLEDPTYVQAYIELARIYMKNDRETRGHTISDGVLKAEQALKVALNIDPEYANTHVLLGYVYMIEGRHGEATRALETAKRLGTKNAWLYFNWGLLLERQNKRQAAIVKYQEGTRLEYEREDKRLKNNERAIHANFESLIRLLKEAEDWARLDSAYSGFVERFPYSCPMADYAQFKGGQEGDYGSAIKYARTALQKGGCDDRARSALALAYLLQWADDESGLSRQDRENAFLRARSLQANVPMLYHQVAASPRTVVLLPRLKERAIPIDAPDARGLNALAYAIHANDHRAMTALLRNGANPNHVLNSEGATLLMYAALVATKETAALLLEFGADPSLKTTSNQTAEQLARQAGRTEIADTLSVAERL